MDSPRDVNRKQFGRRHRADQVSPPKKTLVEYLTSIRNKFWPGKLVPKVKRSRSRSSRPLRPGK